MDFWKKGWEQATKHAQEAAVKAKKLATEASLQAQTYAKQAGENAKSAIQDTSKQLKNLSIDSVLDSIQTGAQTLTETPPTKDELQAYGITSQLEDFLRTLTYSTFRDYPKSKLQITKTENGVFLLSPWQIRHVTLVLDKVKEIQDLRFVLCPQRMEETVFWQIYFTLTAKYLPIESQAGLELNASPPKGLHVLEEEEEEDLEDEKNDEDVLKNQPEKSSIQGSEEKIISKDTLQYQDNTSIAGPSTQVEEGDDNDLDKYIKDVLEDGDTGDLKEDDLVDLENDEDLEKYLDQLGDDDIQIDDNEDDIVQVSKTTENTPPSTTD